MEVKVSKTPRRPNWTEKEKLVLVEAVRQREDRLFGKMKGSGGVKNVKLKEGAWEEVAEAVNAQSDTVERTVEEVRKQYANIKQRAKEKSDAIRRPVTGGGPKPPSPSPVETEILNHLEDRPTLCGLSSGHDTEEGISCTNMEIPINDSTQFGQIIDLQLPSTISTKTSKRRKTMEDEEIKTLKAEREKYIQETIKLKEEDEYYRIKTLLSTLR
ncbi:myb/SANT-like DNA-binding domain-containing protein 4 [Saccostrea echinata]|uniref:myb/SANT-like DNA-binding domain-containing protein 4 n=1 Tax=Saccostrea echinata TaxID=191078 RepID=UPI002A7FF35C|nr:myb/SANT-like DNA-binding domain-containing protein 4 [Saccostrea echinata]